MKIPENSFDKSFQRTLFKATINMCKPKLSQLSPVFATIVESIVKEMGSCSAKKGIHQGQINLNPHDWPLPGGLKLFAYIKVSGKVAGYKSSVHIYTVEAYLYTY